MFTGIGLIPPASAANYVPWAIIGFLSQYVIRRRHFPFWAKYNCADLSGDISHMYTIVSRLAAVICIENTGHTGDVSDEGSKRASVHDTFGAYFYPTGCLGS